MVRTLVFALYVSLHVHVWSVLALGSIGSKLLKPMNMTPFMNYIPPPPKLAPPPLRSQDKRLIQSDPTPAAAPPGDVPPPPPGNCACSKIYDPVCASDNKSYSNRCQFDCEVGRNASVTVLHQGNCIPFK